VTGVTDGIVSGYDGSPGSADALRWAAREAWARNTTLTVCLAWMPDHMELPTESAISDLARLHGKEILARGLPYGQSVLGPGRVHAALIGGSAAHVLCERSRTAEMVVVGSRGRSELPGLRLGSVSWQVAGHTRGRVVIVGGRSMNLRARSWPAWMDPMRRSPRSRSPSRRRHCAMCPWSRCAP
jgi:nucleotide-binding universal stress UspA family protein